MCQNRELVSLVHLGEQALTGVFPRSRDAEVTSGPLELVKCAEGAPDACGLVQLRHSYQPSELYSDNYGYRSGLNATMVRHLEAKTREILAVRPLHAGDAVIDIGSNDSTLLRTYPAEHVTLIGIDPTGAKFREHYPAHVELVPEFFSAAAARRVLGARKAAIITSIAMFYDLESPLDFMREVHAVLADDGVWVFEQSYLPTMLERTSYDTICHEHLEYYGLRQIRWLCDRAGFRIVDVELNDVNGGSFSVMVAKAGSVLSTSAAVADLERREAVLATLAPYQDFSRRALGHRDKLSAFVRGVRREGRTVFGCGASTKGNVILQFCGFTADDIACIADVNADKFGCFTPGTGIPIVSEADARAQRPDYFLVLPWHFRDAIIAREAEHLRRGGKLVMPLPEVEVISG